MMAGIAVSENQIDEDDMKRNLKSTPDYNNEEFN